jgi:pimeloyl-ACP methyl ester carboxylesterase
MHYVRAGTAAPMVFVHGFGCSHEDWLLQIKELKGRFEVAACDLRGHGLTPGRPHECSIAHYGGDVAALLSVLNLEKLFLVGHSMGCRVVLEAARLAPERTAGLVLIDGSRLASGDADAAESAARAAIDKVGYAAFAENLFRQMFFKASPLAEAIVARAMRQPAEIGAALWPRMARWDAAEMDAALAAVRAPLMAIQSTTRDPVLLKRTPLKAGDTSPWLDLLRKAVPGAQIEIIPGVGHFTQLEAADEVNRLIAAFATKCLSSKRH